MRTRRKTQRPLAPRAGGDTEHQHQPRGTAAYAHRLLHSRRQNQRSALPGPAQRPAGCCELVARRVRQSRSRHCPCRRALNSCAEKRRTQRLHHGTARHHALRPRCSGGKMDAPPTRIAPGTHSGQGRAAGRARGDAHLITRSNARPRQRGEPHAHACSPCARAVRPLSLSVLYLGAAWMKLQVFVGLVRGTFKGQQRWTAS